MPDRDKPMQSLESSLESFFDALGELERAVEHRMAQEGEGPGLDDGMEDELEGLRTERAALAAELERLRSQNEMYEKLTEEVNLGLDGAIREIRSVLD